MKFLVLGDTHGKLEKVRDIWPKLRGIDIILHTGDYYVDALKLEKELGVEVAFVKGNCDGSVSSSVCSARGGDFAVVETECGGILLVHGHMEHVNYDLDRLRYKALENNCIAAVFGHTHRAMVLEEDIRYINPGSLTQPRDGSGGTYGIIRTEPGRFDAAIVYYNTIMAGGNKKTRRTGHISDILKYSDRL